MKNTNPIIHAVAVVALLAASGCGAHKTTSRMTTSSTDGRQLAVTIDGRASFRTHGGEHVVTFGRHELAVGSEWLVIDGDKKSFGIPAGAKRVEIKVSKDILTMSADGSLRIRTPI